MADLRVGLNATCFDDRPSGANQRFRQIYGALIRANPDIHFIVYEPRDQPIAQWFAGCPNVQARPTPLPATGRMARATLGALWWPAALRHDRLDLFETFHLPAVIAPDCPTLMTIHDLRLIAGGQSWVRQRVGQAILRHALRRVACTIAVSGTVADQIRAFHPGAIVETVFNGVTPWPTPRAAQVQAARRTSGLDGAFMLAVGHIEARKNLPLLVDAIALLRRRGQAYRLAIVGNDGGALAPLDQRIAAHALGDLVSVHHGVDDATLHALYAACHLVAFPSRHEGFGIPLIEAMAAGKPVVASDIPAFREVTEASAALHFPVDDANAAASAIEAAWNDQPLRARLVAAGTARLALFDVNHLAGRIGLLYRKIAARPESNTPLA